MANNELNASDPSGLFPGQGFLKGAGDLFSGVVDSIGWRTVFFDAARSASLRSSSRDAYVEKTLRQLAASQQMGT